MKFIFTIGFMAIFGIYGLGLVGVLDDPEGHAELKLAELQTDAGKDNAHSGGHYTLKAMR